MELNRLVMCPSKEQEWVVARVKAIEGTKLVVITDDGKQEYFSIDAVTPITEKSVENTDDMCKLPELHESIILHNIRQRYMNDIIYTYIGPMIVSVNPYKIISSYGEHLIPDYRNKDKDDLGPHLFAIAQKAYQSLTTFGNSQAVVISGESGAGKTEATKIVLRYLTAQMGQPKNDVDLAQMILATNPVLEAFGNAKTIRNNNSSRFGKFIKITFENLKITSARIDNYLLETTRVVFQAPEERNYHIFYQFVKGLRPEEKAKYLVKESCSDYAYLVNGDVIVDGIDDVEWFSKTRTSLSILGFTENEVEQIFSLLSSILTLGNITFEGEEQVRVKDEEAFKDFCTLLGVYEGLARQSLTVRIISAGRRNTGCKVPLTYAQAIENRDALAKMLYYRLFDWLVKKLNKSLKDRTDLKDSKFIGILDIYGFEIFTKNSLEQFCINYANEKLHQQFNHHMFKAEQDEYTKEGIPWKEIKWKDNQVCIDLIEKPFNGIIAQLDEECTFPQGTDEGFLLRLDKKFTRNPYFEHPPQDRDQFSVRHFAGTVTYKIAKFLEKNKDTLFPDLLKTCKSSSHDIVREFFEEDNTEAPEKVEVVEEIAGRNRSGSTFSKINSMNSPFGRARGRTVVEEQKPTMNDKRKKATVTQKFKEELAVLVETLASAERHYVRCIKPNDQKLSLSFDSSKVLSQLACNGVFETVSLRKAGFSNRMEFGIFIDRYYICLGNFPRNKDGITEFCKNFFSSEHDWAVGKNKVFMRDNALSKLVEKQAELWKGKATRAQAYIRAYYARMKLAYLYQLSESSTIINKYIRQSHAIFIFQKLKRAYEKRVRRTTTIQAYIRRKFSIDILSHLRLMYNSATCLQKYFRRSRAQQEFHELRAATCIQKFIRRSKAEWELHELRAATCIQKFIRRSKAEWELAELIEIREKRNLEEQRRLVEEFERKRREEEEAKRRQQEEEQRLKEEAELKFQEEERKRKEEEERKRREEEEERRRQEEEERRRQEEEERRRQEEEEEIRRQEEAALKFQEEKRKLEEEERLLEEERKRKDEELRRIEEEERKKDSPINRIQSRNRQARATPVPKLGLPLEGNSSLEDIKAVIQEKTPPPSRPVIRRQQNLSVVSAREVGDRSLASLSPRGYSSMKSTPSTQRTLAENRGLTRRTSCLIMRPPPSPVSPPENKGLLFDIPEEDKLKLKEFFDNVGIPALADHFAQQAVDLETMLAWDDPVQQLQALGIGQQGVIFRVTKAIESYNLANGITPRTPTSVENRKSHVINSPPPGLPFSPRTGSMQQLPVPAGPSLVFTINIISAHLLPVVRNQGGLLSGMDLYVKCDARSFNRRICNYRTQPCADATNPNWSSDLPYVPTILHGMSLCFEIWDSSSFMGDRKVAECIWDWNKLQTLHNGQHWLPLKLQGECVGELLISISNYPEQELEYKWQPDILGGEFEYLPLRLLPGAYGPLTATLVRLLSQESNLLGVLYIHSFSDYFFNTELAQSFVDEGYNFYALDLRRYGRSLIPNIHSNWTTTLVEYFEEIHIAIDYMRRMEGVEKVILLGHGLGGLISVLFAESHHQEVDVLCLNSPLLSLNKNWTDFVSKKRGWFGQKGDPLAKHATFSSLYHQSLNIHHRGEWSWDERLKPIPGFPIFLGWIDMITDHQKRVENGLNIPIPTLVMVAVSSCASTSWTEDLKTSDALMNINKVISIVPKLSPFVKMVLVKDGVHDLYLSSKKAKEEAYAQMFDYLDNILGDDE